MGDLYEKTFRAAKKWSRKHYPETNNYRRAAFANSVVYLVTGASVSFGGGPSIREHIVSWSLVGDGVRSTIQTELGELTLLNPDGRIPGPGEWEFEAACEYAAPICFGRLPAIAKTVYAQEHCFDDDPEDLAELNG